MINKKKFKPDPSTGFSSKGLDSGNRFYRKDGTVNVIRSGVSILDQISWFHTMLAMLRWKFWSTLFIIYIVINLFFSIIYYSIGLEHLGGIKTGSRLKDFAEAFFFSAQTFTTVGYGRISPTGFLANIVATFEAFLGLLGFALASGLFFGRFAKPQAYLSFSDVALLTPHKGGKALMFRTASYKNNHLTDAEVKLTLGIRVKQENDEVKNEFYPLQLEFNKIHTFVLNWTIVHEINEESPLLGLTLDQLKEARAEVMVFLKAYDEIFANSVVARTSYTAYEFIDNAKFKPMFRPSASGNATVLDIDAINDFELLDIK
ncbi:MAG TPA: ion channel [Chitinophagaceae bacterium]|nr:ion channel [Chitinophagaceae bacterium]